MRLLSRSLKIPDKNEMKANYLNGIYRSIRSLKYIRCENDQHFIPPVMGLLYSNISSTCEKNWKILIDFRNQASFLRRKETTFSLVRISKWKLGKPGRMNRIDEGINRLPA